MKRRYVNVTVRLDAMTTIPMTVPAHEVVVLKHLHKGNVVEGAAVDVDGDAFEADAEYGRLCGKYSPEAVEKVFGLPESGNLEKALSAKVKRVKPDAEAAGGLEDGE